MAGRPPSRVCTSPTRPQLDKYQEYHQEEHQAALDAAKEDAAAADEGGVALERTHTAASS